MTYQALNKLQRCGWRMKKMINEKKLLEEMDSRYEEKVGIVPDNLAEGFLQMEKLIKEQPKLEDKIIERLEKLKKEHKETSEIWLADGEFQMAHAHSDMAYGIDEAISIVKEVCEIKTKYDEEAVERLKGGYVYETIEEMLKDIAAVSEYFKEECKEIKEKYRKCQ